MLCGWWMVRVWMRRRTDPMRLPSPVLLSAVFASAIALQLLALTATFTGEATLQAVLAALPAIIGTHPGTVLFVTLLAAICMILVVAMSQRGKRLHAVSGALLALCLALRSGTGHAATEELFSLSQGLQFLHLAGMAVWSGGVIVAGLFVLPRMKGWENPATVFRSTLASLSRASTWSVGITVAAGIGKSWIATKDDFAAAWHSRWSAVLIVKISLVCIALLLGLLNRRWLGNRVDWSATERSQATRVLRTEAVVMLAILLLSGVLANMPPPGE